jgi:PEP-CTERM motif
MQKGRFCWRLTTSGIGKTEAREGEIGRGEIMKRKKFFLVAIALAAVLAIAPVAKASSFDYTFYAAGGETSSLALTTVGTGTTATGSGSFTVGASGFDGIKAGTYNLVDFTETALGNFSVFFTAAGGAKFELQDTAGVWTLENIDIGSSSTVQLSTVPEPSSLSMLGSGLLLLAAGLFWKSRSSRSYLAKEPQANAIQAA